MIIRNRLVEAEFIEQRPLIVVLTSHHCSPPTQIVVRRRNHCSPKPSNHFCNKICQKQASQFAAGRDIELGRTQDVQPYCFQRLIVMVSPISNDVRSSPTSSGPS